MPAIVDTSILIRHQKGDPEIKKELRSVFERYPAAPFITFINMFEFSMGINLWTKNKPEAIDFLKSFNVINTTEETAEIMVSLRLKYDKHGIVFSLSDLIIASLAIENDMILITSDRDFEKIEELEKEIIEL